MLNDIICSERKTLADNSIRYRHGSVKVVANRKTLRCKDVLVVISSMEHAIIGALMYVIRTRMQFAFSIYGSMYIKNERVRARTNEYTHAGV